MPGDDRWRERLQQEQLLLAKAFPNADIDIEHAVVVVKGHKLPTGWSHEETDILVEIPEKYPFTPADNVCARSDLTLVGGGAPGNNQGHREIVGRQWLQFSYHVEASDWHSDADLSKSSTLADYLHGALTRFEDPS